MHETLDARIRGYPNHRERAGQTLENVTISFAVPCYNSADYMDKCIESLLACGEDIEILLVDDGSTDDTAKIADGWQERYPKIVHAIHKPNGGHGSAVNAGLDHAVGLYFKVVDSDDWLDEEAMQAVMSYLRSQVGRKDPTDMVVANYVYEKVYEGTSVPMGYKHSFPVEQEFTWEESGTFPPSKYLLMHSVIYRTQMLKDMGLRLPEHCFYVDNVFVYEPLPHVKSIYYIDVDMYRYFIGREGQSVNETTMMNRMDQQLRVTRTMIDAVDLSNVEPKMLRKYMVNYLAMMMCICTVFLRMKGTDEAQKDLEGIWKYLKDKDPHLYRKIRMKVINFWTNLPTKAGKKVALGGYHLAQKIFKFN